MIPDAGAGLTVLAALCGATAVLGLLLLVAGLRPAPVLPRATGWSGTSSPARSARSLPGRWLPGERLGRRRWLFVAAAVLGGWLVTGWPVVAVAAGAAVAVVPRLLGGSATRRQLDRLEALEAWTRRLADLLGSGAGGLEQAIGMSVRTCPAPIAAEVHALARRLRTQGPEPALRAFADDLVTGPGGLGSPAGDLVAAALILRVRRGGRGLRPVLEALAADVAELVRARRAIEADRAKPRSNVRVLIAITAVVLTLTLVFARDYLAPFTTPMGQVFLAGIVGVFAAGMWLLGRITRLPDAPRFLPDPAAGRPTATAARTSARSAVRGQARTAPARPLPAQVLSTRSVSGGRGSWWG